MSHVLHLDGHTAEVRYEHLEVILDSLAPRRVIDLVTFEPELQSSDAALHRRTPTSSRA